MTDPSPTPPTSPRRVDAQRNRERILAAARRAFADPDADVSMAEIARRAQVGSATLYRNFPDRRQLLEALYTEEIDAVCDAAKTIDGDSAGDVLVAWLRRFYAYFTGKQLLAAELLRHSGAETPFFEAGYTRVVNAGRPLLDAARESGEVQVDLTIEQILDLVVAVAKIPGSGDYRDPVLEAVLRMLSMTPA